MYSKVNNSSSMTSIDFTKQSVKDVSGYPKSLYQVRWNCDGSYLAAICTDRSVKISQVDLSNANKMISHIQSIPTTLVMTQICWHPTEPGRLALCSDDKMVEIWDVRASRATNKISSLGNNLNMAWSPDGNFLAVGNRSDQIVILDVRTGSTIRKKKFPYEVNEFAWSFHSDYLLAATAGEGVGAVDLIAVHTSQDNHHHHNQNNNNNNQASSTTTATTTDSSFADVITPSKQNHHQVPGLQVIESFIAHSSNCFNVSIDSSYSRMAVSSFDCCVTLWDLSDLVCKFTIGLDSEAKSLSFSGDGKYLAVSCDEPAVYIYNADSGEEVCKVSTRQKPQMVSWHPKKALVAIMSEDKSSPVPQYLKLLNFAELTTASS